jgi:hypothetical protein
MALLYFAAACFSPRLLSLPLPSKKIIEELNEEL